MRFPLTCLKDAARKGLRPRVYTLIPLRMGVTGVYGFQCEQRPDLKIGYAAGKTYIYNDATELIYCTTGHFYKKLLNVLSRCHKGSSSEVDGAMVQLELQKLATHINIDEAHCDTTENYLVMSLMRYIRDLPGYNRAQGPTLSILSATLDGSEIMSFFPDSRVINRTAPRFHVDIQYMGKETGDINDLKDEKDRIPHVVQVVLNLNYDYRDDEGKDILVFCSGMATVDRLVDLCETGDNADDLYNCVALRCYGQLSEAEADLVLEPVPMSQARVIEWQTKHHLDDADLKEMGLDHKINQMMSANRKIIFSTNIAESSVTIQNCQYTDRSHIINTCTLLFVFR